MPSLAQKLGLLTGNAFAAAGFPAALGAVRVSDRPDLAQFQCNGAMAAAKQAGKNPREIAQVLVEELKKNSIFTHVEIAGPGFINLKIDDAFIAAHLHEIQARESLGIDRSGSGTIMLDYGGPNVAKPMHVGHLRASIIGDSLRRICAFAGYKAIGDVHLGDWGLPMGQIISELEMRHPEWPYFDPDFAGEYPKVSPVSMDDLEEIYPAASNACKTDEARLKRAQATTADLQNGRRGYRALWQHFIDVSIAGMKKNFDSLGVHFDLWKGEASVHAYIAPMVERLRSQNLAIESDGAWVVPVSRADDKKDMPPLILYKRDGAVMYGTTDLATIVERMKEFSPAKIIYIVDQRQGLHFEQVFRAARLGQIAPENIELTHAGFGTMNGPDGKPFKTRAGGVMKLEDLIAMGIEKASARLKEADLAQDMSPDEQNDIAHKVAIAAIKFADLQNNRIADYMFDIDRMISFEGKTGPYLLYQTVRIKSLLRKAEYLVDGSKPFLMQEQDRALALVVAEMPDYFDQALRNYTPHVLCDYAFRLAQAFSSFYGACHILSETNADLRQSRLALCDLTARQLVVIMSLLGMGVPERM